MDKTQRQLVVLLGFMTLLTVAVLYLFVYADPPLRLPGMGSLLPEPFQGILDAVFKGWSELIEDMTFSSNATSGS